MFHQTIHTVSRINPTIMKDTREKYIEKLSIQFFLLILNEFFVVSDISLGFYFYQLLGFNLPKLTNYILTFTLYLFFNGFFFQFY